MQTFIMFCFTVLCNMIVNFKLFDCLIFCAILQLLLLHLGTDKWTCSLMRKFLLYGHLPGWKTIKFPLIWYIIYWFSLKSYMKNLNLKKCLLSFFAECIFQSYAKTVPSRMKLTMKLTMREPTFMGSMTTDTWSQRVTSDFNSVYVILVHEL